MIVDAAYSLSSSAESEQAFEPMHEAAGDAPRARPVPRVNIHAFCEDQDTAAVIEKVSSEEYYGEGYQDIYTRVPDITNARVCLGWEPRYSLRDALTYMVQYYVGAASP